MRVEVLLFGVLARRVGERRLTLELPEGATVGAALEVLSGRYEAIGALRQRLATAVDMAYVGSDFVLTEGGEMALIPPVSGG